MFTYIAKEITERVNTVFVACFDYSPIPFIVALIILWLLLVTKMDSIYTPTRQKIADILRSITHSISVEVKAAIEPDSVPDSHDEKPGIAGPRPGIPGEPDIPHPEVCHPNTAEADEAHCVSASCIAEREELAKEKDDLVEENHGLRAEIEHLKRQLQHRERSLMEVDFGRTTPAQTSSATRRETKTAKLRRIYIKKGVFAPTVTATASSTLSSAVSSPTPAPAPTSPAVPSTIRSPALVAISQPSAAPASPSPAAVSSFVVSSISSPVPAAFVAPVETPATVPDSPVLVEITQPVNTETDAVAPASLLPTASSSPPASPIANPHAVALPPSPPAADPIAPAIISPVVKPNSITDAMGSPSPPKPESRVVHVFSPIAACYKAKELESLNLNPEKEPQEFAPVSASSPTTQPNESSYDEEQMDVDRDSSCDEQEMDVEQEVAPPWVDSDVDIYDASPPPSARGNDEDMEMSVPPEPVQEAVNREVEMGFGLVSSPTLPSPPRPFSMPANAFQSPSPQRSSSPSLQLSPTSLPPSSPSLRVSPTSVVRSSPSLQLSPSSVMHSSPLAQPSPDAFALSSPAPLSPVREEEEAVREVMPSPPPATPTPASRDYAALHPRPPPGVVRRPARSANPLLVPNRRKSKPQTTTRPKDAPCAQLGPDGRAIPSPRPSPTIRPAGLSTPTVTGSTANASPSPRTVTNISFSPIAGQPPPPTPGPPRLRPTNPAVKRTHSASCAAVSTPVFGIEGRAMAPLPARAAVPRSAADEDVRRKAAERSRHAWRAAEQQSSQADAARAAEEAPRQRMPPVGGQTSENETESINHSVLTVGSNEVARELDHILQPLWSIIDARAISRYGQRSLRQLAVRRWTEALEDDGYPRGTPLTRMQFERLVGGWMEAFIEDLVAKRILSRDDDDVEEILDLWRGHLDQQGRLPPS
ncbi:hypothetical protein CMUS01_04694 [Colletotrichum musicola]|uniref:Uncharacterized protein n=1 Tax=Colletotrichum musicola TaxID=2175873 RepID=A0A8H6KW27_9PEZI|nr:hypothetical protein CMUS01_04694 [Colletotrichum musicola]